VEQYPTIFCGVVADADDRSVDGCELRREFYTLTIHFALHCSLILVT